MTLKVIINNLFEQKEYTEVEKVFLPSLLGDATLQVDHISMLAQVDGEISLFFPEDRVEKITVNNGIASVDKDIIKVFF
jgi:F0F1-type ATP synthase epsilon subunit